MRLARNLSLNHHGGETSRSSFLSDMERRLGLRPSADNTNKVFMTKHDVTTTMKQQKQRSSNKKPQSLDWFQDAWKDMTESSKHSSTNNDDDDEDDNHDYDIIKPQQHRAESRHLKRSKSLKPPSPVTTIKPPNATRPPPRRSKSLNQEQVESRQLKSKDRSRTSEHHHHHHRHEQPVVVVQPKLSRKKSVRIVMPVVVDKDDVQQQHHHASYVVRRPNVEGKEIFSNRSAFDKREIYFVPPSMLEKDEEGQRPSDIEQQQQQQQRSPERKIVKRSKSDGTPHSHISRRNNGTTSRDKRENTLLLTNNKPMMVSSSDLYYHQEEEEAKETEVVTTTKEEMWKKRFQKRVMTEKVWKDLTGGDEESQCADFLSVCMMSLGAKTTETLFIPNDNEATGFPTINDDDDGNDEQRKKKKNMEQVRQDVRALWKHLTERERKLDCVRKNARHYWSTLTERERTNIDFILAALESTELPEMQLKPFDWITNEELLHQERLVVMAILKNEAAFALLGDEYRVPDHLRGDRAIMLEYVQARCNRTVGLIPRGDDAAAADADDVPYNFAAEDDITHPVGHQQFDAKTSTDSNAVMMVSPITVPPPAAKPTIMFELDGQESGVWSTAIIFNGRGDDSSLSTYRHSDDDNDTLPSVEEDYWMIE